MLKLGLELDSYKPCFAGGQVELGLSPVDRQLLDGVNADVEAAQFLKFEYLCLMSLNDPQNKKSTSRIEKYTATVASVGKRPWQSVLHKDLVVAVEKFLGIAPADAAAEPAKDKKEKKDKSDKKDKK